MSLQEKLETLKQLDSKVLELTEDNGLEVEIQNANEYKDGIHSTMVGIDELSMKHKPPAMPVGPNTGNVHAATLVSERIKLLKLAICQFDGDVTQWTTFWDSYNSSIHTNAGLTDVDKFFFLTTLTGNMPL